MRKIIRTEFTLVMPRYGGWTSDLDPSVEIFALYYPERRAAMETALTLARTPSVDKARALTILDGLGAWLVREYDRVIWPPPTTAQTDKLCIGRPSRISEAGVKQSGVGVRCRNF